jgi:hypothetical protein
VPPWRSIVVLCVVAIVVSVAAIAITVLRGGGSSTATCRTLAWDALPDGTGLPDGWTVTAGSFYADGAGTSLTGPEPSDGSSPPTLYLQVTCYGSDSQLAMSRSHESALAAGSTDVPLVSLGEESFSTEDPSSASTSVYVRRGGLVAILVGPTDLDPGDFEQAARAVDAALARAGSTAVRPSPTVRVPPPSPSGGIASPSAEVSETPSEEPSATPAHVFPALEALLPKTVGGVTLSRQSTLGTTSLSGGDPSSQALIASLTTLGKTPADMQIAAAYDDTSATDLQLFAFKVTGVKGSTLGQAIVDSYLAAGASGMTTAKVTISGKAVTHVMYGDGGADDYVYVHGDVVFDVATGDPASAIQAFAALP